MRVLSFLLPIMMLFLSSCSRQEEKTVMQADRLLREHPDKAMALLDRVDRRSLEGRALAHYALTYYMTQDHLGMDVSSDSLLRLAYDYFSLHPQDSLYARTQYYMGVFYILSDSVKQAEDCLSHAAQTACERGEHEIRCLALDRLSQCMRSGNPTYALQLSRQALRLYEDSCATSLRDNAFLLQDLGLVHILCKQPDSALYYLDSAYDISLFLRDSTLITSVLQSKSNLYYCSHDATSALLYARQAQEFSKADDMGLLCTLANSYAAADSLPQAIELYRRIASNGEPGHRYQAFKALSAITARKYGSEGDVLQNYLDSACNNMERMYRQSLKAKADYYQETLRLEKERHRQDRLYARRRIAYVVVLGLMTVALALVGFMFLMQRERSRRRMQLEEERHRLQLAFDQEKHAQELIQRDNKIALMRKYILACFDLRQNLLSTTSQNRSVRLSDELWQELEMFLQATDTDFLPRLRAAHPRFRDKDYQFCMLVRMGFPLRDLALMYSISLESMKQKLHDYKQLFDLPSDGPSFRQYIMNF